VTLYSYVVEHDFGFAPNPFFGICTLAACKPGIRKQAHVGDFIMGTGSAKHKRSGLVVYYMVVEETMTFDQYWKDARFAKKRPSLQGSLKFGYGDNIYHRHGHTKRWVQEDSFHSRPGGRVNLANLEADTITDRVLAGTAFTYWGGTGPAVPARFRNFDGRDICVRRGYGCTFSPKMTSEAIKWLTGLGTLGCIGMPTDWEMTKVARL
jgi:hypothetical protein